jgi:phosphoenolpyruvate carboxylase
MCTQHPDHASLPYWDNGGDAFITAGEETRECFSAFSDLGAEEFMWDWEGKYVDEAVVERLVAGYFSFFKKKQLGKDIFLTYRIPNIWAEPEYPLSRAFMTIISFAQFASDMGFREPPIFEVILPMADSAKKIIYIQKTFTEFSEAISRIFNYKKAINYLNVLPLVEDIGHLVSPEKILTPYFSLHKKYYGSTPAYLRPHIARSDPAMNAGLVPAVLSAKAAISGFYKFGEKKGIEIYPAIGVGSLPFRGACNPNNINEFLDEYKGARTIYIQSAFRYDYPLESVKRAIGIINKKAPNLAPEIYTGEETEEIKKINEIASRYYRKTIERLAPFINKNSKYVPRRRERRLHVGLFGYARAIGNKKLPRAIPFTAILYSLGVPPEFIGTGRAIKKLNKKQLALMEKIYVNFKRDLIYAGRFLNKYNLAELEKINSAWSGIAEDIKIIENYLNAELVPWSNEDRIYTNLTGNALLKLKDKKDIGELVAQTGRYRRSLG